MEGMNGGEMWKGKGNIRIQSKKKSWNKEKVEKCRNESDGGWHKQRVYKTMENGKWK